MRDNPLFIVPTLVVIGNLVYLIWMNQELHGLDRLGPVLGFMFVMVPLALLFLAPDTATAWRLRAAVRPRGPLAMSALATLVGLAAIATTAGLVFGVLMLEA